MSETLHVSRMGRTPTAAVELVHSPDDGGYYLGNTDFQRGLRRTSVRIYPTADAAKSDWRRGTVDWEDWY